MPSQFYVDFVLHYIFLTILYFLGHIGGAGWATNSG